MALPEDNEEVDNTPAAEVESLPDPRDLRLAEMEIKLAETESRLRAVSKAYADQRNEITASRERAESHLKNMIARKEGEVARIFFEPVQNLQRSLEAHTSDTASLLTGVRMVLTQCLDGLHRLGLREVPGVGSNFDPNLHEAIGIEQVADEAEDDTVVTVHLAGYTVGNVVLQPAKVIVGKFTRSPIPEA